MRKPRRRWPKRCWCDCGFSAPSNVCSSPTDGQSPPAAVTSTCPCRSAWPPKSCAKSTGSWGRTGRPAESTNVCHGPRVWWPCARTTRCCRRRTSRATSGVSRSSPNRAGCTTTTAATRRAARPPCARSASTST